MLWLDRAMHPIFNLRSFHLLQCRWMPSLQHLQDYQELDILCLHALLSFQEIGQLEFVLDQVAEGVATAGAVISLAQKYKVKMPVLTAVTRIIDNELTPQAAVLELMNLPQETKDSPVDSDVTHAEDEDEANADSDADADKSDDKDDDQHDEL